MSKWLNLPFNILLAHVQVVIHLLWKSSSFTTDQSRLNLGILN